MKNIHKALHQRLTIKQWMLLFLWKIIYIYQAGKKKKDLFSFSFLITKLMTGKSRVELIHNFLMLETVISEDFDCPVTSKPSNNENV